jgi:hypothetical protein
MSYLFAIYSGVSNDQHESDGKNQIYLKLGRVYNYTECL